MVIEALFEISDLLKSSHIKQTPRQIKNSCGVQLNILLSGETGALFAKFLEEKLTASSIHIFLAFMSIGWMYKKARVFMLIFICETLNMDYFRTILLF